MTPFDYWMKKLANVKQLVVVLQPSGIHTYYDTTPNYTRMVGWIDTRSGEARV